MSPFLFKGPSLRAFILAAAHSRRLRAFAQEHGLRFGAQRFVAGTTLEDLVARARRENEAGRRVSCAYLGEGVRDAGSAARVAADFLDIVDRVARERLEASVAVKLTHLGLDAGPLVALENATRIVERAAANGIFVRMDMEEARYVEHTLEIYRALRARGLTNVGVVLQSYLRRSSADLRALLPFHPNLRIVKGAYSEPPALAYQRRAEIDAAFKDLVADALAGGAYVAVATHDRRLIDATLALCESLDISPRAREGERLEFQMLLGVRESLQDELVRRGLPVRVSVPFGTDWYPYLMRRLAEKPSNLWLIARNLRP